MSNFKDLCRVGKDAVTRFTKSGEPVAGFWAAFDSGYGESKQSHWLDCSIWGKRGESVAAYLLKGSLVMVEGELGTREHEGKTYLTLRVSNVKLTGKVDKSEPKAGNSSSGRRQSQAEPATDDFEDDPPF